MTLSFKSANIRDEKNAKERSRRSGYVVSKKFRVKLLPPPSVTRMIFKDKKYQLKSLKSPDLQISAFTPLHLVQRIRCSDPCKGGKLDINYAKDNDDDFQCLYSINVFEICFNTKQQPYIVFNSNKLQDYKKQYGVGKGIYYVMNVSINDAFTVLNHEKEEFVYLVGEDTKKFTKLVDGREYSFYYGNVFFTC